MLGCKGEDGKCVCCWSFLKNNICKGLSDLLFRFAFPSKFLCPNLVKLSSCRSEKGGTMVHGVSWAWLRWAKFCWIRHSLMDLGPFSSFHWFDGTFLGIWFHFNIESLGTKIDFKLLLVLLDVYFLIALCPLICHSIAIRFRRNVAWTILPSN